MVYSYYILGILSCPIYNHPCEWMCLAAQWIVFIKCILFIIKCHQVQPAVKKYLQNGNCCKMSVVMKNSDCPITEPLVSVGPWVKKDNPGVKGLIDTCSTPQTNGGTSPGRDCPGTATPVVRGSFNPTEVMVRASFPRDEKMVGFHNNPQSLILPQFLRNP